MLEYLGALGWGIAIFLAAAGFGAAVVRSLWDRDQDDLGLQAVAGLAVLAAAGGIFNLLGIVRPWLVAALVVAGIVTFCWSRLARRSRDSRPSLWSRCVGTRFPRFWRVILAAAIALAAVRFAASVSAPKFNGADDYQAYFVYPTQMIQTGAIQADGFAGVRPQSALGGGFFLDAMVLAFFSHTHLDMVDAGIGLLALLACVAGLLDDWEIAPGHAVTILLLVAFLPPPQVNTSSLLLSAAFAVGLTRVIARQDLMETKPIRTGLLVGLVAGGTCTLKSNMIPYVGLLLPAGFLLALFRRRRRAVVACAAATVVCLALVMWPWMVAMHQAAGTYLYPLLGRGFRPWPAPGHHISNQTLTEVLIFASPYLLGLMAFMLYLRRKDAPPRGLADAALASLFAAGVGVIALDLATGGEAFARRPFPFCFDAIVVMLILCVHVQSTRVSNAWRRAATATYALLLVSLVSGGIVWGIWREQFRGWATNPVFGMRGGESDPPGAAAQARRAQQVIPPGGKAIAVIFRPFLLDFRRNWISVPGQAESWSPPPYIPAFAGPSALRRYLLSLGIRYVIVSPRDRRCPIQLAHCVPEVEGYGWIRDVRTYEKDFYQNVESLIVTSEHVYDDGLYEVLDLQQVRAAAPQTSGRNRLSYQRSGR